MLYFFHKGYRVIAHDRRGHCRSTQVGSGHDMDYYATDVAEPVTHLDLKNAVYVDHSTGGREATHYIAQHANGHAANLVLIGTRTVVRPSERSGY